MSDKDKSSNLFIDLPRLRFPGDWKSSTQRKDEFKRIKWWLSRNTRYLKTIDGVHPDGRPVKQVHYEVKDGLIVVEGRYSGLSVELSIFSERGILERIRVDSKVELAIES